MKIGVVDYKAGNLRSVENLLRYLDADYIISGRGEELIKCDKLLFPGVGEASYAMNQLKSSGLDTVMREFCKSGKHIFGICLGCQIILEHSEEGDVDCLGLIPGKVRKFPSGGLKVPEIGWNNIRRLQDNYILKDVPDNADVYFVHSYYPDVESRYGVTETEYMLKFNSVISCDNVTAAQFHPEKSGRIGIQIMKNFIEYGA